MYYKFGFMTTMSYPRQVYVKGLPLLFSGWNGVYEKTDEISEDAPVYYRKPHRMFFALQIIGIKLKKYYGQWVFHPDNGGAGCLTNITDNGPLGEYVSSGLNRHEHPDMKAEVIQYHGLYTHIF